MKTFILFLGMLCLWLTASSQQKFMDINPIIHDQSYVAVFGVEPDETTDDQQRIKTHLAYAEQLLRNVQVDHLTKKQRDNRNAVLDLLKDYYEAGIFPVNRDYLDERRPCFIDGDGTICAVGYLIEQTKGRDVAEAINKEHQYDFLLDMKEPVIAAWADEYGFTLEECAIIQPAYGPPPTPETRYEEIKPGYGASSAVVSGVNIAFNIANLSSRGKYSPTLGYLGIIAGTGQLLLGATNIKKAKTEDGWNGEVTTSYKKQNNLSYVNMALGTTTIITSAINLLMNKKNKESRNAFNLYSYPNYTNSLTMGLSFTRSI